MSLCGYVARAITWQWCELTLEHSVRKNINILFSNFKFWIKSGVSISSWQSFFTGPEIIIILGKQGWCSGESTRLPPMWPGFDSRTRRHKWVEFVVGSLLCLEGFSPGSPVFLPHRKPTYSWFQLAVSCAPRSHMDRIAAARGAIVSFRFDLVELRRCCTLRRRLAVKTYYYFFLFHHHFIKNPIKQIHNLIQPAFSIANRGGLYNLQSNLEKYIINKVW